MPRVQTRNSATAQDDAPVLLDVFTRIGDAWELNVDERCRLLGGIPPHTHYDWTHGRTAAALSLHQREAIAHVIGVDVALLAYYGEGSPNIAAHLRQAGTAPDGDGTALATMLSGITGLAKVRYDLEARCGGSPIAALLAFGDLDAARPQ